LTPRWGITVAIQDGELLSSWLVRTALAQGCDPLVLTGHLWPKWRIWTIDLDRGLSADRLNQLATASGIDATCLDASTFRAFAEELQIDVVNFGTWPWLLSQGSRNRRHHGGLQYCPRCLEEDAAPYLRRTWRLAWHTACERHEEELRDRCPACQAVPEPHRLVAFEGRINRCATCRTDLTCVPHKPADPGVLAFQRSADSVLRTRSGSFGNQLLGANEWFSLARFLIVLIRRASSTNSQGLQEFLALLGIPSASAPYIPHSQQVFESLPTVVRAALISPLLGLMEAGPAAMVKAARGAQLTAASFLGVRKRIPDAFHVILSTLPMGHRRARRLPKKINATPRSPAAVLRHCVRMQRRWARS